MTISATALKNLFDKYRIPYTNDAVESLRLHAEMLTRANDDKDLSRLVKAEDILIKHYLDCAIVLRYIKLPSPLLDIGTGAGFPGMVLKILSPETEMILGEPRHKRTAFIQKCIDALGITGASVYAHRIGPGFSLPVQGVITRALETIPDTLKRVSFFLPEGGKVILLKGPGAAGEQRDAERLYSDTFAVENIFRYNLENEKNRRVLYIYARTKETLVGKQAAVTQNIQRKNNLREITSPANADFSIWRKLSESREIRKHGLYIVSGDTIVRETLGLANGPEIEAVIFNRRHTDAGLHETVNLPRKNLLADKLYEELDFSGTGSVLLVCRYHEPPDWDKKLTAPLEVFLPFQDPGNLGTAIRTCAAMGVKRIVLLKEAANAFQPKATRAAGSALYKIKLAKGPALAELCQEYPDLPLILADAGGKNVKDIKEKSGGLVFGIEGPGFSGIKTIHPKYSVPLQNGVESLNAPSALAMMLYAILN